MAKETDRFKNYYRFDGQDKLSSPCIIFYKAIIQENIENTIALAGSAARLWPHIKTHKTREIIHMMIAAGIQRFKCATIAEAEMCATCHAKHVLLSYPLVGPNIERFLQLVIAYPTTHFYALGDDFGQIQRLSERAVKSAVVVDLFVDVNLGMNRTGVALDRLSELYIQLSKLENIQMAGLHGYDGNNNLSNKTERMASAKKSKVRMDASIALIREAGVAVPTVVVGGTPSFSCFAEISDWYLSPGTFVLSDYRYAINYPEMKLVPAAVILARVVSHPSFGCFTIDVGSKAIATDPQGVRGTIVGMEDACPVSQSEEHWVFSMPPDKGDSVPSIGTELFIIPTHVCPSVALYEEIPVVEDGKICDVWKVAARNRKLTI